MSVTESTKQAASGNWFFPALTLILIVLKLVGYFPHSWWIVLMPLWGPLALFLCFVVLVFIVALIAQLFKH